MPKVVNTEGQDRVDVEYDVEILAEDEESLIDAVMILKCTEEGVIIDIEDPETGEVIKTAYMLLDDLIEMTH